MDFFNYRQRQLYAEDIPVTTIAERYGTPVYVYSRATLERHWQVFDNSLTGLDHMICYAVKANSNLAVLQVLAKLGSGFDIVSLGELERVLAAGGDVKKVVFSGVGKTEAEIETALRYGILCFNVESAAELTRIAAIAQRCGKIAPVSLRVNPDVDAQTHPYIATGLKENKFGIAREQTLSLCQQIQQSPHLQLFGIDCHIGSQLTRLEPFAAALDRLLLLLDELAQHGIIVQHLNVGGGLGVRYLTETPPTPEQYGQLLREKLAGRSLHILIEPGRAIAANAGILVTRVEYIKPHGDKTFVIVDAAMNDLLRPAIYAAEHDIIPVRQTDAPMLTSVDVVGPVCETGDFLGKNRDLAVRSGDLLAVRTAGAYGFSMSSNYNSRPRVAEIMVDGDHMQPVRTRETIADLFAHEALLDDRP